jgi:predicted DNA-binding transcriptional regulator AlpA
MHEQVFDQRQAAELLGLSPATLASWRSRGRGPAFLRLGGRAIRYRRSDLERFLERERVVPNADEGSPEA